MYTYVSNASFYVIFRKLARCALSLTSIEHSGTLKHFPRQRCAGSDRQDLESERLSSLVCSTTVRAHVMHYFKFWRQHPGRYTWEPPS